jgi:hypothetical protein
METFSTLTNEQTDPAEMSKFQLESNIIVTDLSETSSRARRTLPRGWPHEKYYDLWMKYPLWE